MVEAADEAVSRHEPGGSERRALREARLDRLVLEAAEGEGWEEGVAEEEREVPREELWYCSKEVFSGSVTAVTIISSSAAFLLSSSK